MKIFPIIPIWIMFIICITLTIIIKKNKKNINQIIIVIILFIINLRIMIPSKNNKIISNDLDVLFVIDNTLSIIAEDYNGQNTRLSAIKNDCKYIIEKLNGASFALITFNDTAKIVIPFTKDTNLTIESINFITPKESLYAKGSSLNTPLEPMKQLLESSSSRKDKKRILFFISDGEITNDSQLESYSEIKKYINNGAVLGYGTTNGGYMKDISRYNENNDYIKYFDGKKYDKAISKIDEKNLQQIANDLKIEYINMNKQENINKKINEILKNINNNYETDDKTSYEDTYFIITPLLLILLILELNKYRRNTI